MELVICNDWAADLSCYFARCTFGHGDASRKSIFYLQQSQICALLKLIATAERKKVSLISAYDTSMTWGL